MVAFILLLAVLACAPAFAGRFAVRRDRELDTALGGAVDGGDRDWVGTGGVGQRRNARGIGRVAGVVGRIPGQVVERWVTNCHGSAGFCQRTMGLMGLCAVAGVDALRLYAGGTADRPNKAG